jgi:7-keto-8-aminopelargonate synthetase-like enzyme
MGHQAGFRSALLEGIERYGTIFSASRNNNLQLAIYNEAEDYLAQWTGAEAALTVTSGLLAGQLAVHFLKNKHFMYAPGAHPAVWSDTPQLYFDSYEHFTKQIADAVKDIKSKEGIVIASNSIDPLFCEYYNFDWITQLPDNQDITLLIDDSHGMGITGTEGGGIFNSIKNLIKKENIKLVVIASMAKALGIPGGVILSDKKTIAAIRSNPLFIGASPIVPAYLYAFLKSESVYHETRMKLFKNIDVFKNSLTTEGVYRSYEKYPVFFCLNDGIFDRLYQHKIFISHFPYPKAYDKPITRIVLSALHLEEDIFNLVKCLQSQAAKM